MGYEKSLCLSLEGSLHRGAEYPPAMDYSAHTLAAARRNETCRIRRFAGIVGSDQYTAGNNGTPLIGKYAGGVAITTAKCEGSLKGRTTDLWLGLTLLWLSICSSGPKHLSLQQQRCRHAREVLSARHAPEREAQRQVDPGGGYERATREKSAC